MRERRPESENVARENETLRREMAEMRGQMKALAARLGPPVQPVVGRDETAKRAAFGEVPPRGMEEQALRLADRIAAAGSRTQGLARGEAAGGVGAAHSSSEESDESTQKKKAREPKVNGGGTKKKKDKKKDKKKKDDRSSSVSPSNSGASGSDDESGSSNETSGRVSRHGGRSGAGKLRRYEAKKKAAKQKPMSRWRHLEGLATKAGYTGNAAVELPSFREDFQFFICGALLRPFFVLDHLHFSGSHKL